VCWAKVYRSFLLLLKKKMPIQVTEFVNRHLPTVIQLLNDEYRNSREFIPFDEERVLSQIRRRHLKILVAEENGRVLGLVATHSHENSEEDVTWLTARKGIDQETVENTLMDALEKKSEIKTVSMMVDEKSSRIPYWINRGYTLEPGYQRMSAKLYGLRPIPKIDEGIKLRSLANDEEEELVETVNAGFGWKRLEIGDLEVWKSEDPPFNEDWVQVADMGKKIVSVVVSKPDTESIKYLHVKRGYLGPAATLPEFRNKHLGTALTARAMNFLFEKGMNSVRLGTSETNVSSHALLISLGFQVEGGRKTLRKKLKNA
jgi:ribosomal protein S18 acetylase RimI-like enzyme